MNFDFDKQLSLFQEACLCAYAKIDWEYCDPKYRITENLNSFLEKLEFKIDNQEPIETIEAWAHTCIKIIQAIAPMINNAPASTNIDRISEKIEFLLCSEDTLKKVIETKYCQSVKEKFTAIQEKRSLDEEIQNNPSSVGKNPINKI